MSYKSSANEILNYAVGYLTERYGMGNSIINRGNYIKVIAHIMSTYGLSYNILYNNWPSFFLSDLIPQFKILFLKWLSSFIISELNQYTKTLVEIMSDRIIADIIYDKYLKHLKSGSS